LLALNPVLAKEVTFAPTLATVVQGPAEEEPPWTVNPDSFDDLSAQARLIWLDEATLAIKPEGAAGTAGLPAHAGAAKSNVRVRVRKTIRRL
jgi:hypothetical protein